MLTRLLLYHLRKANDVRRRLERARDRDAACAPPPREPACGD